MNDLQEFINSINPNCSVCNSVEIYFQSIERSLDKEEINGRIYIKDNIEIIYYCEECFQEYGGKKANYV